MKRSTTKQSILAATMAAVTISLSAFAFAQSGGEHRPRMEQMLENLQLDETQMQSVKDIMQESHDQHEALREATHARLAEILTEEQMEKLNPGRPPRGEKRMGKPGCDDKPMEDDVS